MKTILNDIESEIIINKSRFITNLIKIEDNDDAKNKLEIIKNKYHDATHNCYAYVTFNYKKMSDDKEPNGTAGLPILNVLENNDLVNILCVVTRYFGGIKLGTGGLTRAYTNSVTKALDKAVIKDIEKNLKLRISFDYNHIKDIDFMIKNADIIDKKFDDIITYELVINYDNYLKIKDNLIKLCISLDEDDTIYM